MPPDDDRAHDVAPPRAIGMKTVWARRGARQQPEPVDVRADHVVDDFVELRSILVERYGLPASAAG